jgi:hypothetical protein
MFFDLLAVRWNDLRGRYRAPQPSLLPTSSPATSEKKVSIA